MLSVIIPAYNEEAAIGEIVQEVRHHSKKVGSGDIQIIVVNDGSTDRTAELADKAGAEVISHPCNAGYGHALKSGIVAARNDTIAIMDGDGTYPPEMIPDLLKEYNKGFDLVVGARTGKYYRGSIWRKYPLRLLLTFLVEFACGKRIPDVNSGLRVFNRNTVKKYFPHLCNTFSFTTSMTLAYIMTGRFVTHVQISYAPRTGKSKVRMFRDSLLTLQYVVQATTYYDPLKIFTLLSFISAMASLLSAMIWLLLPDFLAGYVMSFALFIMAILLFAMGLLAVLLKQIMDRGDEVDL